MSRSEPIACAACAQRQHLGVGRGIAIAQRTIARAGDHPPIPRHGGPDWDFAPRRRGGRLVEGGAHGVWWSV